MSKKSLEQIHYEKYKPLDLLYIGIMVICAIIRLSPLSTGSITLDEIFNDFSVGACASTWAAWLLDKAQCRMKNKDRAEKERMVFSEYSGAVTDLCFYISRHAILISNDDSQKTLSEWLNIVCDEKYYIDNLMIESREYIYKHLLQNIHDIESSIKRLRNNYTLLVYSDIVDTDDLLQHISRQVNICDEIIRNYQKDSFDWIFDDETALEKINTKIVSLVDSFMIFFPKEIDKKFSAADICG